MRLWWRSVGASVRMLAVATLVLGVLYPALGLGMGLLLPHQAQGSLIRVHGQVVGSELLGEQVTGDEWFYGRPSASDASAGVSGASNLGPNNPDLVAAIAQRREEVAAREGVDQSAVPADAVTASASGVDPHISVAYARLQVPRVAREQGLTDEQVLRLVERATTHRQLGVLGEDVVNVTLLNVWLAAGQ